MKPLPERIYLNTGENEPFPQYWNDEAGDLEYIEQAFARRLKKLKDKRDSQTSMQIKSEYSAIMHEIVTLGTVIGINLENI